MNLGRSTLVALGLALAGCGGNVAQDAPSDGGAEAMAEASIDTGIDVEFDAGRCKYANGATMCSKECAFGDDPDKCEGCVTFRDTNGGDIAFGVCYGEGDKMLGAACPRCSNPSYLCARQPGDDLQCVNPIFCETAKKSGVASPC